MAWMWCHWVYITLENGTAIEQLISSHLTLMWLGCCICIAYIQHIRKHLLTYLRVCLLTHAYIHMHTLTLTSILVSLPMYAYECDCCAFKLCVRIQMVGLIRLDADYTRTRCKQTTTKHSMRLDKFKAFFHQYLVHIPAVQCSP